MVFGSIASPLVHLQEILGIHHNDPGLPVSSVYDNGNFSISRIPFRLVQSCVKGELLHALDLLMNSRESGDIRAIAASLVLLTTARLITMVP